MSKFTSINGESVQPQDLQLTWARDLAQALLEKKIKFAQLIDCRISDNSEHVIVDVDVEVPTSPVYRISPIERIAFEFSNNEKTLPKALALRRDFPQAPHLNIGTKEIPKDLCLWTEGYDGIAPRLTAYRLVERTRKWLADTSENILHQEDQPLEPLMYPWLPRIVLPHDLNLEDMDSEPQTLYVYLIDRGDNKYPFLKAAHQQLESQEGETERHLKHVACVFTCQPQVHGTIRNLPLNLAQLHNTVNETGLDLLSQLRDRIKTWLFGEQLNKNLRDSCFIIILLIPKKRTPESQIENVDTYVFLVNSTVDEIGKKLNIYDTIGGTPGALIGEDELPKNLLEIMAEIELHPLSPCFTFNRKMARKLNAVDPDSDFKICAVGVGALGSQVVMNMAHSGYGKWTLIDPDHLLPHNLARHAAFAGVGLKKSDILAHMANTLTERENAFSSIPCDITDPKNREVEISSALSDSCLILDMSTKVSVARHLTFNIDSKTRRASLFLNPSGKDLVLLAEDSERKYRLDALEMQYLREIKSNSLLEGHLDSTGSTYRYGLVCSDISSQIAHDDVAVHAATGSKAIKNLLFNPDPQIIIWRSYTSGEIACTTVEPSKVKEDYKNGWTVITDEKLVTKLTELRSKRLPKETGGILIGRFDLIRNIIYVVEATGAPLDSLESRNGFIRGKKDLERIMNGIKEKTGHQFEYIGEWHSHPEGLSSIPSLQDRKLFSWISQNMDQEGLPPVMLIVSDQELKLFVSELDLGIDLKV